MNVMRGCEIIVLLCNSLVHCDLHGNEIRQVHSIIGAPHDVHPPSISILLFILTWGGFTYFSLDVNKAGSYSQRRST